MYVVCAAFYTVFSSTEVQEWNHVPEGEKEGSAAPRDKRESPKLQELKKEFHNLAFELEDSAKKGER